MLMYTNIAIHSNGEQRLSSINLEISKWQTALSIGIFKYHSFIAIPWIFSFSLSFEIFETYVQCKVFRIVNCNCRAGSGFGTKQVDPEENNHYVCESFARNVYTVRND